MIEIYLKTNTNYDKNGDITLDPTSCTYKESEKELTLEHFLDEEGRWKYIDFENVIAAEENGKKKLYRIYNVVRSLYSVTAYARPIFYDLVDKVLLDVRPTDKIAEEALNIILDGTGFKGHSNLNSINTSYYIRKNIVEALIGDTKNSFLNRWGGEFYCENFDVYINDRIGSDNGVRVEFGYNLNEIEEDINIDEVVTRIIPVGYDGIMLDGNSPWLDSPLINKYTHIKTRVIEFSDIKVKDESSGEDGFNTIEEARTELIRQCNLLFENGIDKPTVNYKIDMINLANTTAYKDFEMLVNVNKGDTVTCYIPHLDIDVQARVIDFEKDLLTGEYISIELGNATNDFFKNQSDIQNKVDSIFNDNGNVKAETLEGAINALQTKFKALRDIAQPQSVRAILFEDRIEDSPTFGCMCLGTMGFEIASKFKPGTQEWDFRTFGTGQGFVADYIITGVLNAALIKAGILQSENEKTWINMEDGTFDFANKVKFDGENFTIDLSGEDLATGSDVEDIKSEIKATKDEISLKVGKDEVISAINLTPEQVKISANKINLQGYVTVSDLKDGQTVISGDNIQTGTIDSVNINACTFRGKNMVYIEDGGVLSCDGTTYVKDFRVMHTHPGWEGTGFFHCSPIAYFEREVRTDGEFWAQNNGSEYLGLIRRASGGSGKIQIDRMRIINGSSKNYIEIACYNNDNVFGVDVWSSDERLKENIKEIDFNKCLVTLNENADEKIGLDLIKNLNHYSFDYIESFGGGHVTCGYISQELQDLNNNLVIEVEQQDGTTLLQPSASNIIPNLSLAIKQQQEIIEDQQNRINNLEEKLANLETLLKEVLNK